MVSSERSKVARGMGAEFDQNRFQGTGLIVKNFCFFEVGYSDQCPQSSFENGIHTLLANHTQQPYWLSHERNYIDYREFQP
jgi:hypothetical protein